LIIIDKNSLLGEASIRKKGVVGKNKIAQNIGSFMGSRLDKRGIHWDGRSKPGLSPSGTDKIGISVLPAGGPLLYLLIKPFATTWWFKGYR
jgi:hypothetical protein